MVLPSDFRQKNFHAHDPPERALDFHVKAGQDWNVPPVIAVLIRIPWIPAAAKVCRIGCSGGQIGIRRRRILCGRAAGRQEPCEGDRYQPPIHPVDPPLVAHRLNSGGKATWPKNEFDKALRMSTIATMMRA